MQSQPNLNSFESPSFQHMTQIPLRQEDLTLITMNLRKEPTSLYEDQDEYDLINNKKIIPQTDGLSRITKDRTNSNKLEQTEDDCFQVKLENNNENNITWSEEQQKDLLSSNQQIRQQLEPFQKEYTNSNKCSLEIYKQHVQDIPQQAEIKINPLKQLDKKFIQQSVPKRFKFGRFLKIWKFYKTISTNSRLFSKLTKLQHDIINDKSSFYKNLASFNQQWHDSNKITLVISKLISFFYKKCPNLPIFMRSSLIFRLWEFTQAICIISTIFSFSIIVFFQENPLYFYALFKTSFFLLLASVVLQFNIADIKKGNIISSRKYIAENYLKTTFLLDILGLLPLFTEILQIEIQNVYVKYSIYLFILLLNVKLVTIVDRLTFYLCYEKDLKNTIDLVKLIFIIGVICHIFCLFWHGIAIVEIQYGQKNTWLHLTNLDQEISIIKRYIYSFYYLATTMITVGYGDITPQNQYEISFTILTMFVTGFYYAYSLNKIGSILDNINKKDKLYNQQMQIIHGYMRNEIVSSNLKGQISSYLKYLYKESNEVQRNNEKQIIDKLSKQLKIDLIQEVSGKYIQNIPFLNELKSKNKIIELMEECVFSPGEKIFTQGDQDDFSLYFIVKGEVQILFQNSLQKDQQTLVRVLQKGNYFGEFSFLTNQTRFYSAVANDFCRLYRIQKEKFMNVIKQNDYDFESFCMTRDKVLHSQQFYNSSIKCYTCDKGSHHFVQCPKTHYIRSKQNIILRYNYPIPQVERNDFGRKNFKYKSLSNHEIYFQAAYLINQNYGNSLVIDEIQTQVLSDLNQIIDQETYDIYGRGSNNYLKEQYGNNNSNLQVFNNKNKIFALSQSKKDRNIDMNDIVNSLKKIDELSEEKGNISEQTLSDQSLDKKDAKSKIDQSERIMQKNKLVINAISVKNNKKKAKTVILQNPLLNILNRTQTEANLINEQQNSARQQHKYDGLEKDTINLHEQKKFDASDLDNTQLIEEKKQLPSDLVCVKEENEKVNLVKKASNEILTTPNVSSISSGYSQSQKGQKREFNQNLSVKIPQSRFNQKEERLQNSQIDIQQTLSPGIGEKSISPTLTQSQNQYNNSLKNLKTCDILADSSHNSLTHIAKSFFSSIKRNSIQRQNQLQRNSSQILQRKSDSQNTFSNLEFLEIMKKVFQDQNRGSFTVPSFTHTINFQQLNSNIETLNNLKNSSTARTSLLSKIQKRDSDYQGILNQDKNQEILPESIILQQPNNLQYQFKENDQELTKWGYDSYQLQKNYLFDYTEVFDVGKIFKRYFPQFNQDIILKKQKKQHNSVSQERKRVTQSSFIKQFENSPQKQSRKTFFSQFNLNNNLKMALKNNS